MTTYLLVGWSSIYQEPGFEMEFKTLEEAKLKAKEILERQGQTDLRIFKGKIVSKGRRGNTDKAYIFESE